MSKKQKTAASESDERQFWQMVFETHQGSGLSVKAFCQKEGLAEWTFYHRKKRLRQGSVDPPGPPSGGKPLASDESVSLPRFREIAQVSVASMELRIEFPTGVYLHVPRHCDRQLLRDAVGLLREEPC